MSWIPESHKVHLALTAVASGAIAASAVIGLQNAKKWYNVHDLKGSIPELSAKHDVERVGRPGYHTPSSLSQSLTLHIFRSTTSAAPPQKKAHSAKKTSAASPSPAAHAWETTTKP